MGKGEGGVFEELGPPFPQEPEQMSGDAAVLRVRRAFGAVWIRTGQTALDPPPPPCIHCMKPSRPQRPDQRCPKESWTSEARVPEQGTTRWFGDERAQA